MEVDAHLKKLYKRTDAYLRAMSSMCECARLLSDDLALVRRPEAVDAVLPSFSHP